MLRFFGFSIPEQQKKNEKTVIRGDLCYTSPIFSLFVLLLFSKNVVVENYPSFLSGFPFFSLTRQP